MFITRLTGAQMVDAPLTLISKMGHGVSCFLFWVQRLSILLLCITTTKLLLNYRTNKTKNCWRSVDTHFQDGAGSVSLSLLPIKDGNTSIMCIHYQIGFWLPDFQDLKSLTLLWRSFCHGRKWCWQQFQPARTVPGKGWDRNQTVATVFTPRKSGPLQFGRFFHQKPGIRTSQLWLQLSIWVLIILWGDQYIDCAVLQAHSPPAFRYAIRPIFMESRSKTCEFRSEFALFSQPLNEYELDRKSECWRW